MNIYSEQKRMTSYFPSLLDKLDSLIENSKNQDSQIVIYLEGGHFNSSYGADDFSINSLNDACFLGRLLIKKYQRKIRLMYGVLVDNLGMSCSEETCSLIPNQNIQEKEHLPDELESIITENTFIKRDKLVLSFERATKNRAIKSLKMLLKNNVSELSEVPNEPYNDIIFKKSFLLARRKADQYVAKCPALIAQHYKDIETIVKKRFPKTEHCIIIDWSELDDKNKVVQGKQASTIFKNSPYPVIDIINIFFCDDKGEIFEINFS